MEIVNYCTMKLVSVAVNHYQGCYKICFINFVAVPVKVDIYMYVYM